VGFQVPATELPPPAVDVPPDPAVLDDEFSPSDAGAGPEMKWM
jgi:hypothetical protein